MEIESNKKALIVAENGAIYKVTCESYEEKRQLYIDKTYRDIVLFNLIQAGVKPINFMNENMQVQKSIDAKEEPDFKKRRMEYAEAGEQVHNRSSYVHFSNVPDDLSTDHFVQFLNKLAWSCHFLNKPSIAVKKCNAYNKDKRTVCIEFSFVEVATCISFLSPLQYDESELILKQETRQEEEISSHHVAQPVREVLTNCVFFSQLPEDLVMDHFTRFLNKLAWRYEFLNKPSIAVKRCNAYDENKRTICVEFSSVEVATHISFLSPLQYDESKLILKQETRQEEESSSHHVHLFKSCFVSVFNLPKRDKFSEEHLVKFLTKKAQEAWFVENLMAVVKSIGEYSEIDFSIKLEFVSSNIAQKMCLLSPMTYENLKIELRQERSIDTIHEEAFIGHADSTAPRPLNLRLKTDYKLFVQLLYNLRHSFRGRNYDSALARLKADLRVHNIYEDIDSLRKKRTKVIVNNYKTMSKSGGSLMEFCVPVGVIKGKLDERKLTGSLFEKEVESVVSSSDFIEPLCFFEEAAVWTNVATKALIKACIEHREDYKKHEYRTRYWQKIRKYLYEKKHYYSAAGCEGKMLQLKRTFRDEEQARRQTGAPGPSTTPFWEFYEDMRQLMEGDVTVTPHVTAAFGSSQVITEKEKISLSSHKENSQRIGKAGNPSAMRRPFSSVHNNRQKTGDNYLVKQDFVDAYRERTALLKHLKQ